MTAHAWLAAHHRIGGPAPAALGLEFPAGAAADLPLPVIGPGAYVGIAAWVVPLASGEGGVGHVWAAPDLRLYLSGTSGLRLRDDLRYVNLDAAGAWAAGRPLHVVVEAQRGALSEPRMWLDGLPAPLQVAAGDGRMSWVASAGDLWVGNRGALDRALLGVVADVRVRAAADPLADAAVAALYAAGPGGAAPGDWASRWALDEGPVGAVASGPLLDSIGAAHGTPVGDPSYIAV